MKFFLIFVLGLLAIVMSLTPARAADDSAWQVTATAPVWTEQTPYPEINLRGYGKVSGRQWLTKIGGSLLEISCEDEAKAKLTLAKYLSDLSVLPGVKEINLKIDTASILGRKVEGQGIVTAWRGGRKVFVLVAPTAEDWGKLAASTLRGNWALASFKAELEVPKWLNRWDKYGFLFYYAPFALPQKDQPMLQLPTGITNETYDFLKEFDFAKDYGSGLVLWSELNHTAEGLTSEPNWHWIAEWAKAKNIPLGVNLSNSNFSVPYWIANRYRDLLMKPMPGYLGDSMSVAGWRGLPGKNGELTWGADEARDATFGTLQAVVRRYAKEPQVIKWLEPHGEFYQGGDAFMGAGPQANRSFREFLKTRYSSLEKLGLAWQGKSDYYRDWKQIKAPELARFAGWNEEAVDLAGTWRIQNPEEKQQVPEDWKQETFDDSSWLAINAPGDDHSFFLTKKLAVYRRTFELPAVWRKKHPDSWIYLWDLNTAFGQKVEIYLNGQKIGDSLCRHPEAHWMSAVATAALRDGNNQLTLVLPSGYLGYKIYLSPTPPQQYPNLGNGLNTQWVDFVSWREASRMESARRGVEMIREVDPNRQIDFMAPHASADGLKGLIESFGGNFKDTGFMSGCWADLLPSLMRGSNMPFGLEPGCHATKLSEFKNMLGLWHTEGLQGVDYFIHLHWVMLHPEIRQHYEQTLPLFQMFGKYHQPPAELAFLWTYSTGALTGYPWGFDPNMNLGSGWFCKGLFEEMLQFCPRDAITESDFARGNAARYKVIIDTNSSILDEATMKGIEKYVRDGGVFVTFTQTGRHSPSAPNAWPISSLTGYTVLSTEKFDSEGRGIAKFAADVPEAGSPWQPVMPAPGQSLYADAEWMKSPYLTGLRMQKTAADAADLLLWNDGTVAVGRRPLGKGYIVQFGCKSNGQPWLGITPNAFLPILDWRGVVKNSWSVEGQTQPAFFRDYIARHYLSNNGLYDVWSFWNPSPEKVQELTLVFKDNPPTVAREVQTGKELSIKNSRLAVHLEPLETRLFLTPRRQLARAPGEWFELQRNWWRGITPVAKGLPPPTDKLIRILSDDWTWQAVAEDDKTEAWADPAYDDAKWERIPLGIWNTPDGKHAGNHAFMRKSFTVPAEWSNGRVELRMAGANFRQDGRIWLDGKLVHNWYGEGLWYPPFNEDGVLKAETNHVLALEIRSKGALAGFPGDCWLEYVPAAESSLDLAGNWTLTKDALRPLGEVTLPGKYEAKTLRRKILVPEQFKGKNAVLSIRAERTFGALINGSIVTAENWRGGNNINITPWLRYGKENDIELISVYDKGDISRVALDFYTPGVYP